MATPKLQFLTPEQESRVQEYQDKWQQIALSTEKINPEKAAISVIRAYKLMGHEEPRIIFCQSPNEAIQYLRQSVNGEAMEALLRSVALSPKQAKQMTLDSF